MLIPWLGTPNPGEAICMHMSLGLVASTPLPLLLLHSEKSRGGKRRSGPSGGSAYRNPSKAWTSKAAMYEPRIVAPQSSCTVGGGITAAVPIASVATAAISPQSCVQSYKFIRFGDAARFGAVRVRSVRQEQGEGEGSTDNGEPEVGAQLTVRVKAEVFVSLGGVWLEQLEAAAQILHVRVNVEKVGEEQVRVGVEGFDHAHDG